MLRYAGLLVAAAAVVVAVLPFRTGVTLYDVSGAYPTFARSCGPPIVEVTRTHPTDAGWFGYAPLTSTPLVNAPGACHDAATGRLAWSAIGLLLASLLGWVAGRFDGGSGSFRRIRWRPRLGPSA
jgi:hypothetical protein